MVSGSEFCLERSSGWSFVVVIRFMWCAGVFFFFNLNLTYSTRYYYYFFHFRYLIARNIYIYAFLPLSDSSGYLSRVIRLPYILIHFFFFFSRPIHNAYRKTITIMRGERKKKKCINTAVPVYASNSSKYFLSRRISVNYKLHAYMNIRCFFAAGILF